MGGWGSAGIAGVVRKKIFVRKIFGHVSAENLFTFFLKQ